MKGAMVLSVGTLLALVAAFAQALAGPLPVRACSCMEPMPGLAAVASEPNVVILAGTIGPQQPERTPVHVDTWFHGPGLTEVVWLSFGSQMTTSCDPFVTEGERRLMVVQRQDDGLFSYWPCAPAGVIGTEAGDAALAEAEALFSVEPSPTPPPTDPPETEPPATDPPTGAPSPGATDAPGTGGPTGGTPTESDPTAADPNVGWLFVIGTLAVAGLAFALVALLALRRRTS